MYMFETHWKWKVEPNSQNKSQNSNSNIKYDITRKQSFKHHTHIKHITYKFHIVIKTMLRHVRVHVETYPIVSCSHCRFFFLFHSHWKSLRKSTSNWLQLRHLQWQSTFLCHTNNSINSNANRIRSIDFSKYFETFSLIYFNLISFFALEYSSNVISILRI